MDAGFLGVTFLVAALAGSVASVSGFGIGSLLTPLFALRMTTKLAVAAVSVPHVVATAMRLWLMRKEVDRKLLLSFGLMSAAGGLVGALLQAYAESPILTLIFGLLLTSTGLMELTGYSRRLKFHGWMAWAAGAVSGLLGGLVGNQGGIRSAAMLGFDVPRTAFVATATAVGVIVDAARMPIYLITQGREIAQQWPVITAAIAGAVLGTLVGERILWLLPEQVYRRTVGGLVLALGVSMLIRAAT